MNSSLHVGADDPTPDISAFVYSVMRLPQCLPTVDLLLMGQSDEVFDRRGFPDVEKWQPVTSLSRRRKMFFDGDRTLAAFIASVSDIDDLIPMLTAYQIEWNKLHMRLANTPILRRIEAHVSGQRPMAPEEAGDVADALGISADDFTKLQAAWGPALWPNLLQAGREQKDMAFRLLAGSLTDYRRATDGWWYTISQDVDRYLQQRPVLPAGLLCLFQYPQPDQPIGRIRKGIEAELAAFLQEANPENLWHHYQRVKAIQAPDELSDLLYYALAKYLRHGDANTQEKKLEDMYSFHRERGLLHVENPLYLDVAAQVVELKLLRPESFDRRVCIHGSGGPSAERRRHL